MEDMYAEDAVFDISAVFTDTGPMHGRGEMRRYWDELRETWAGLRTDPIEAFDLGEGRYAVDLRLWGKGEQSGIEVDQRFGAIYTFRAEDGKITRNQLFPDVETAISAAESSAPRTA
jgi:ketosteroid isomerase-like protein